MARRPRIHFPGALYHVISRGNQRQVIFKDQDDFRQFQIFLGEAQKRFAFIIHAYVLMPNHLHLLLQVGPNPLSRVMQTLLYRYTRHYNKRYRKVGHLFQGRYTSILCDGEEYLLELIRYLHLNPVRAHIVKDPRGYPWSSHRLYLGGRDTSGVAVEEILARWSQRRGQAIKEYERFVLDGIRQGHREEYYELKEQRYLGEEDFVERLEKQLGEDKEEAPVEITVEEIVQAIGRRWGKKISEIRSKRRTRQEAMIRAIAAYVGREVGGITLTETARYLRRDLATLSLGVRKLEEGLEKDARLRQRIRHLCKELRRGRKRKYKIIKA